MRNFDSFRSAYVHVQINRTVDLDRSYLYMNIGHSDSQARNDEMKLILLSCNATAVCHITPHHHHQWRFFRSFFTFLSLAHTQSYFLFETNHFLFYYIISPCLTHSLSSIYIYIMFYTHSDSDVCIRYEVSKKGIKKSQMKTKREREGEKKIQERNKRREEKRKENE